MDVQTVRLGIAPIAWTNDDLPDLGGENTFEQCVSEMALAGYAGSEVGNKYPKDPHVLAHKLALRNLCICNQWFSSFLTTRTFGEVEQAFTAQLDFLQATGATVIGPSEQGRSIQGMLDVPIFGCKPVFGDQEWESLASGLDKLGALAAKRGFRMCYHHHMGTGCQTLDEIDRLMEMTDPAYVWLLFDSGHAAASGDDPASVLEKHIHRVGHVHLKDLRPDVLERVKRENLSFLDAVRAGVFTVPGDGCIDFPKLFSLLNQYEYHGWMVVEAEQDPAKADPLAYAMQARAYIRRYAGI